MGKDKRPVNLDLGSLKFPPMAIASILHRVSGLVMFLLLPIMLCYLSMSLTSETSFNDLSAYFANPWRKLLLWAFCSAWVYHVMAGIRHILMDIGIGERLEAGRRIAVFVIFLAIVLIIFLGIRIW